ncbi:hypothetical protein [Mesorhizobium carmichaelinearum]|uniref:hypothetical protein n=1 Tax=Mesorhizobium carmichaelinearum TaxID=1208188 RepID=UPI0018E0703D|nr:hypothetical protein [Mesorhizobium carmichaelinearum]
MSANRLYVQASVYDEFAEKLTWRVSDLRVSDGLEVGGYRRPADRCLFPFPRSKLMSRMSCARMARSIVTAAA